VLDCERRPPLDAFDRLPREVRERLARSRFNICAACMTEEARAVDAGPEVNMSTNSADRTRRPAGASGLVENAVGGRP
jgi:hypothetical protein